MAAREHPNHGFRQQFDEDENSRRGAAAQSRVERGQVSRARHELTGAPLAPQTMATLDELRAGRPEKSSSPIPREVRDFPPQSPLSLDGKIFAKCLRPAPSGCSLGAGGCTNEILRVCLNDAELLDLLSSAAKDFARAAVPGEAMRPFMLASTTALQKRNGEVPRTVTSTSFHKLVAKTLARQFGREVEEVCSPFRAGSSRGNRGGFRGHNPVH